MRVWFTDDPYPHVHVQIGDNAPVNAPLCNHEPTNCDLIAMAQARAMHESEVRLAAGG